MAAAWIYTYIGQQRECVTFHELKKDEKKIELTFRGWTQHTEFGHNVLHILQPINVILKKMINVQFKLWNAYKNYLQAFGAMTNQQNKALIRLNCFKSIFHFWKR